MAKYKVDITGINTNDIKVLTNEEMNHLFVRLKNGDIDAKTELINGNLKLVLSILRSYNRSDINLDDLFQVGCIGLIKAIDNFDVTLNVQFSTYAVPMIVGEIRRYLRDNNSIRVSRSIRDLAYRVLSAKEKLTKQNEKEPTIEEIEKELNVPKEDIIISMDAIQEPISLQEPVYGDNTDNIYVMDQISDKKNTDEHWADSLTISSAIQKLNDKEKMIINKRFFEGRTQMEVADEIGISQAQVSRLEKNAIDHIKRIYKQN